MARYRDADALKERLEYFSKWCKDGRKQGVDFVLDCPLPDMPTADVAPRAEWISVEERMPLNFESVLVLATSRREDDGYDVLIAYHDRGEWEERCVHGDGGAVYAHVKYWMPLPEPPKAKQPKDLKNFEKKRLLAGDCFHGEIWYRCPYCFTGIEAHSIPKDRICHKCGKEYLL